MQLCTPHSRHWLTASPFLSSASLRPHRHAHRTGRYVQTASVCASDGLCGGACREGDIVSSTTVPASRRHKHARGRSRSGAGWPTAPSARLRLASHSLAAALLRVHPHRPTCHRRTSPFVSRSLARPLLLLPLPLSRRRRVLHGQLSVDAQGAANKHGQTI